MVLVGQNIRILSIKAWCPEDGGHEFEVDDVLAAINLYADPGIEIQCPDHGWKDGSL